ncbi:MAG TPA: glycosyltransferase [Elusimicrobiota bacterium]|nr:glycosyltransferase [Elusimicrobiota bacterium]
MKKAVSRLWKNWVDKVEAWSRVIVPSEREMGVSRVWEVVIITAIVCGVIFLLVTCAHDIVDFHNRLAGHPMLRVLAWTGFSWTILSIILLAARTIGWFSYAAAPSAGEDDAPTLTVVIPAYNEGHMVRLAIDSAARARYPRGKLRVVVVDDGSKDDTWEHISAAAAEHPGVVIPVRQNRNRGKREALAAGFRATDAEVLVIVDSDSVIAPDALLAIAGPFRDPKVGAVAGKVSVYNLSQGFIPCLLYVNFLFIADFMRSWESNFRTVHCCAGALMAVRASAAKAVMEDWLGQTFLGGPCTIGDDRSLTNFILLSGLDTVYQRSAVVRTVVPATYSKLCRMFLRWDRSYIREETRFLRHVVWSRPLRARIFAFYDRFVTNTYTFICYTGIPLFFINVESKAYIPALLLAYTAWISMFYLLYYLRQQRLNSAVYAFLYPYYSVLTLFWIFPYAALTLKNRSWMTR